MLNIQFLLTEICHLEKKKIEATTGRIKAKAAAASIGFFFFCVAFPPYQETVYVKSEHFYNMHLEVQTLRSMTFEYLDHLHAVY